MTLDGYDDQSLILLLVSHYLHVGRELFQCLVEIVHLGNDAYCHDNTKSISGRMSELIIAGKCKLDCNAECFDRHDRY